MNTSEVICRYLTAAGINEIYGYPGDPTVELIEATRTQGMEFVLARREGTASESAAGGGRSEILADGRRRLRATIRAPRHAPRFAADTLEGSSR